MDSKLQLFAKSVIKKNTMMNFFRNDSVVQYR